MYRCIFVRCLKKFEQAFRKSFESLVYWLYNFASLTVFRCLEKFVQTLGYFFRNPFLLEDSFSLTNLLHRNEIGSRKG